MDFFVMLIRSPGWIFGPLMMLAGLAALVACVRATVRRDRLSARQAVRWALVPPVLGALGALFGLGVWAAAGQAAPEPARVWSALGCTILFGVFVALVPALWALALLRRPAAVG